MRDEDRSGEVPKSIGTKRVLLGLSVAAGLFIIWMYSWTDPTTTAQKIEFAGTASQVIAGAFILGGLYFTFLSVRSAEASVKVSQQSLTLEQKANEREREAHAFDLLNRNAERFYNASDQLADASEAKRIAGLLSLERLANEQDEYYHQVIEVVCAYLRSRAAEVTELMDEFFRDHEMDISDLNSLIGAKRSKKKERFTAPEDIQVAVTILARRRKRLGDGEAEPLNLRGVNLAGTTIKRGDFDHCDFSQSTLIGCEWLDCNLAGAHFLWADLRDAMLFKCIFVGADFTHADVSGSLFWFSKDAADPLARIAAVIYSGTTPHVEVSYERYEGMEGDMVPGAAYLQDSNWMNAELDNATIRAKDLSGMRWLTTEQFEKARTPPNAVKPDLVDLQSIRDQPQTDSFDDLIFSLDV